MKIVNSDEDEQHSDSIISVSVASSKKLSIGILMNALRLRLVALERESRNQISKCASTY